MLGAGTAITVLTICMPSGDDGLLRWRGVGGEVVNGGKRAPGDVAVLRVDGGGARGRGGKTTEYGLGQTGGGNIEPVATKYSIFDLDAFSHKAEKASEKDHPVLRGLERLHLHTCAYDDMTIVVSTCTVCTYAGGSKHRYR